MIGPGCWVPADQLLARLERRLRAAGVGVGDIDDRIAAELGVDRDHYKGYCIVRWAADRYQRQDRQR